MNPVLFVADYLRWHYSAALFDILRVWGNFLWFVLHTSSFLELLTTLFSPWKRMREEKPPKGTFDPGYYAGSILVNIIMRFVGLFVRLTIILFALIAFSFVLAVGAFLLVFWLIAPFAIFYLLFNGIALAGL